MITAQRTRSGNYVVGNFHSTLITKEEYEEILNCCDNKETELPHGYIIYMDKAPKEVLSKYAKKVRESEFHRTKSAKEIKLKIASLQSDLNAINELESLI